MKFIRILLFQPLFFLIDGLICLGIPTILALPERGNPNFGDLTRGYYYCGCGSAIILLVTADLVARSIRKQTQATDHKG